MSYLISENGCVFAETTEKLKSGTTVRASFMVTDDAMNTDREFNLVNAGIYRVSNTKKHDNNTLLYACATAINGGNDEFLLEDCQDTEK